MRLLLSLLICLTIAAASRAADQGIVPGKPAEGPSVAVSGGFMIPYEQSLPGTDVTFTMIPVPAGKVTMLVDPEDSSQGSYEVATEPLWIGKHEVTWGEYRKFMELDKVFARLQILRTSTRPTRSKSMLRCPVLKNCCNW